MADNESTSIVVDAGSGYTKAGFAGDETPRVIFPSIVDSTRPITRGAVTNWDQMEKLWQRTFADELKVDPTKHSVLLTVSPNSPKTNREKIAQIMFETFQTPGIYMASQAVLALQATNRTTGIVLDSGYGVTNAVPIYEGYAFPDAITRINVAGNDLTEYLKRMLNEGNVTFGDEPDVVQDIKEKLAFVVEDSNPSSGDDKPYELSNGSTINIPSASLSRTAEALFQPWLLGNDDASGIHEALFDSIKKCNLDIRRDLASHIVLSGGSTMFPGIAERIEKEMRALAPHSMKITIDAPKERKYLTWIGGSMLASQPTFENLWISKQEYDEAGVSIVHRTTN